MNALTYTLADGFGAKTSYHKRLVCCVRIAVIAVVVVVVVPLVLAFICVVACDHHSCPIGEHS